MAILIRSRTTVDDKNRWGTQWKCFWDAKALYGREFDLDVCAEPETAKVNRFYTSLEWLEEKAGNYFKRGTGFGNTFFNPLAKIVGFDALQQSWEPHWWCNPPFDMKVQFVAKAAAEARAGNPGMMLLPYEPLTGWWQQGIEGVAAAVYEPDGRYNFLKTDGVTQKKGVNFGSVFVLFTPGYFPTTQRIRFKRGIAEDLTINFRETLEAVA